MLPCISIYQFFQRVATVDHHERTFGGRSKQEAKDEANMYSSNNIAQETHFIHRKGFRDTDFVNFTVNNFVIKEIRAA